ncbi:glucosaminidase domain-containing protein [Vagococcus vulneris]|uniref:glucosaminidase domain-containing protein n=1 Tax=Vagococcus vulneris TaxID=1977869 RepID=UPI00140241EA|nr:glucosaminidase domain-containing protein [Vagococcus vulneris]
MVKHKVMKTVAVLFISTTAISSLVPLSQVVLAKDAEDSEVNYIQSNSHIFSKSERATPAKEKFDVVVESSENDKKSENSSKNSDSEEETTSASSQTEQGGSSSKDTESSEASKETDKPSESKPNIITSRPKDVPTESESSDEKNSEKEDDKKEKKKAQQPISFAKVQSTVEFVEEIGEDARQIGQENDLYASVMIAQAILESASGNSSLARTPNNNLFGIKGEFKGKSVSMATLEDDGKGGMFTISAKFRKYPTYKESLQDYATLLKGGPDGGSNFYRPAWKSSTKKYTEATKFLTGRYATDTRYHEKLNGLIDTYELTRFDSKKALKETVKKDKDTEKFISDIAEDVQDVANKEDLYPSVLIADAVMKSQSGYNSLSQRNNFYQIKGNYRGKSITVDTVSTDKKKKKHKLKEIDYKVYPNKKEGVEDYVKKMQNDKKSFKEFTRSEKDSYRKVTAYMTAKNREDRKYHKKLNGIINTYDLTKYDKQADDKK